MEERYSIGLNFDNSTLQIDKVSPEFLGQWLCQQLRKMSREPYHRAEIIRFGVWSD